MGRSKMDVPKQNIHPTVTDIGLTRKQVHEAHMIRDAESATWDGNVEKARTNANVIRHLITPTPLLRSPKPCSITTPSSMIPRSCAHQRGNKQPRPARQVDARGDRGQGIRRGAARD
jgi:hypothetical protein